MTRRIPLLTFLLVAGAIGAPAAQQRDAESVERVRVALAKSPPRLTLNVRPPDFTIEIRERRPLQEVFDTPPWVDPRPGWQPPAVTTTAFGSIPIASVDLLAIGGSIARKIGDIRRAHAARDASEEVGLAIASYCAAQPNAGAGIQICTTSFAIR
jgi:hypothetical protein